jgi:hypothetical protein
LPWPQGDFYGASALGVLFAAANPLVLSAVVRLPDDGSKAGDADFLEPDNKKIFLGSPALRPPKTTSNPSSLSTCG